MLSILDAAGRPVSKESVGSSKADYGDEVTLRRALASSLRSEMFPWSLASSAPRKSREESVVVASRYGVPAAEATPLLLPS